MHLVERVFGLQVTTVRSLFVLRVQRLCRLGLCLDQDDYRLQ